METGAGVGSDAEMDDEEIARKIELETREALRQMEDGGIGDSQGLGGGTEWGDRGTTCLSRSLWPTPQSHERDGGINKPNW